VSSTNLAHETCPGRIPTTCGYCFGISPKPSASSDSASHEASQPVFNTSPTPVSLPLSVRQPLHTQFLNRHPVLACLRPRRYSVAQHLFERPHVLPQARRHRRCARPPYLRQAPTVSGPRGGECLAQAGVGQHEVVVDLEQRQMLAQPVFALTRRGAAPSHRRHPLTQAQMRRLQSRGGSLRLPLFQNGA